MDPEIAVESVKLAKSYGKTRALNGVTLKIASGQIYSILGRNGAGKTTFVRIATGQLLPTSGKVLVGGFDVVTQVEQVRKLIALVPQESRVINSCTILEFLQLYLILRGEDWGEAKRKALQGLKDVGILKQANDSCNKLSGGNRHKLVLACAIASGAPILFLDEPTIGLDAQSRRSLWDKMIKIKRAGKTIVLTTHYLDEAEVLSDQVAVISKGKVLKIGTPKQIVAEAGYQSRIDLDPKDLSRLKIPGGIEKFGFGCKTRLLGSTKDIQSIAQQAFKQKIAVSVGVANLEDAFIKLVGAGEDETEGEGGW
jgi:ABC-2 type transport system ATP-binding protein